MCALLRSDPDSRVRDYGVLSQMIDTTQLRGKRVRLRIAAHAEVAAPAFVYLFCRIDRPGVQKPFFQTRRISGIRWRDYEIAAPVAIDAERLEFGLVLGGDGRVWADDAVLEVVSR